MLTLRNEVSKSNFRFTRVLETQSSRRKAGFITQRETDSFDDTMENSQFTPETIARFWCKVNKDGPLPPHKPELGHCWIWTASIKSNSYGSFYFGGKVDRSHRFSFLIHGGILTPEKPCVLHSCDNPSCCNPNHLFAGSQDENISDMVQKGRNNRTGISVCIGQKHGMAKLTENNVIEMRCLYSSGKYSTRCLAKKYGVSRSVIQDVIHRRAWIHIGTDNITVSGSRLAFLQ